MVVLKRKISSSRVGRAMRKRKPRTSPPVQIAKVPEHPIFTAARGETDDRRRRFFVAFGNAMALLTADDMDKIEPIFWNRIGAAVVINSKKMLDQTL